MQIKYIEDDPSKGIAYDWKKIKREYRKLGIPAVYYNPLKADLSKCGYNIALSDRSRGKTTNCIIMGMIMNALYGTVIHYIRTDKDTIAPKNIKAMFDTIIDNGYIYKITNGRWNSCYYYGKRWYYCNLDDDGEMIEKSPVHFCICMSLDESDRIKSSYNCPTGDIIIYDEFISFGGYGYSDFIRFADMISTIFRKRLCCVAFLLSNTVDRNSPWFDEFCIRDIINTMDTGDSRYIETNDGTTIFIDILNPDETKQRKDANRRFFGFLNPKLAAITGKGTWATDSYPHIVSVESHNEDEPETKILHNRLFVRQSGKLVKLQLVENKIGICVYVMPATRLYKDSIILVSSDIKDRREIFGFGARESAIQLYWRLYRANRFYYATNAEGALIKSFVRAVQDKQRQMMV